MKYVLSAAAHVLLASVVLYGALLFLKTSGDVRSAGPVCYSVDGNVLVNGKPAQDVHVAFHPRNGDPNAFCPVGRTDSHGVFHLTTQAGVSGAPAGEYNVTFVWPDTSIEFDECECPDPLIHDRFKGLYASTDPSGHQVTVGVANNSFRFSLWRPRSDDPRP